MDQMDHRDMCQPVFPVGQKFVAGPPPKPPVRTVSVSLCLLVHGPKGGGVWEHFCSRHPHHWKARLKHRQKDEHISVTCLLGNKAQRRARSQAHSCPELTLPGGKTYGLCKRARVVVILEITGGWCEKRKASSL